MFGLEIIEVALGLTFMYFLLSTICSLIFEAYVKIVNLRAKHMEAGLRKFLNDPDGSWIVNELYEHHLIKTGLEDKLGKPTYISATNFATALMDVIAPEHEGDDEAILKEVQAKIDDIPNKEIRDKLTYFLKKGKGSVDSAKKNIETWFDNSMRSVSEWYHRKSRWWSLITGTVLVVALNADTIRVAKTLWNDDELRETTAAAAQKFVAGMDSLYVADADTFNFGERTANFGKNIDAIEEAIGETNVFSIGWKQELKPWDDGFDKTGNSAFMWWLYKVIGLCVTIGAVSLGAAFWYRALKKIIALTGRGPKEAEGAAGNSGNVTVNVNSGENSGAPANGNPGNGGDAPPPAS